MTKAVMLAIGHKAVEEMGKSQLWLIPRHLRREPSPMSSDAVRECLRRLRVFFSDDNFAVLTGTYGAAECDLDRFLKDFSSALLNPRRRHVVDLVLKKLDPDGTGLVEAARLFDCYDVLRHPAVLGGTRCADDVAAEFFDSFVEPDGGSAAGSDDVALTCEELVFYYCGLSLCTPKDEDFELRCIRSFSLDRPKFDDADEAGRLSGSRAVSRQSRLLGEGRTHPLYTTTNSEYGSTVKNSQPPATKFGRSQKFTRNQPPRSGGATSMNM